MQNKNIIHQLSGVTSTQMMSYVIETDDGKCIVIDGGLTADAKKLVQYIKDLNGGTVHAWILTHPHLDHIDAFCEVISYDDFCGLEILSVYYNFPDISYFNKYIPDGSESVTLSIFNTKIPCISEYVHILKIGERINIGSVYFDVLWTYDENINVNIVNNSSVVLKMYIGDKTFLITGDLGVEAGQRCVQMYGNDLHCDIVEMAHHGQNGADFDFYKKVSPNVCLWCTPLWLWENNAGKGYDTHIWKTIVVRGWMSELGVRSHYITKDGDADINI